ncbi:MAG TPA: ATP-binding protein [Candidatus Binatia bacterium]|nr:ATP-binding protein [Candidatus Binatia bacterium]
MLRDITAQPSIKDATQELVLHNCSFFEHALEGIFRSTPAGRFTAVNPALVRMLGYESAGEVLALTLPDDLYVDPTQRAHLRAAYEAAGVLEGVEVCWKKKRGEHIIVSLYARTIRDTHGTVIGYEGMVLDITERKRAEAAVLEERSRMAREVHDSLAQGFAGIVLQLEAAKRALTVNSHKAQVCLEEACALARAGLAEARRSVMALRPQVLEHNDLSTALAHLAAHAAARPQTHVAFHFHGTPHPLSAEVETNLLRITQEALTNACNHAQAQNIKIALSFALHQVELFVQDDGRGFDIHRVASGSGFGLTSMRERAEQIGGRLTVTSRPGEGTKVVMIVPDPDLSRSAL